MSLEPILTRLEYSQCPVKSSFSMRLIILVNVISLFLEMADMGLTEIFTIVSKSNIKYSVVIY